MLHYSVVFLVIALIAAVFGFVGIAAGAVEIAKILFFIFAIMAVISFVVGLMKRRLHPAILRFPRTSRWRLPFPSISQGPHEKPTLQPFP